MADGLGSPFSYPTASLAAPPVVIGSPAGGGAGFNLTMPTFTPSAPKYYDPNSLPGVIPPVDASNIVKGLMTGIQAGVQIGQIPVTQRKQALQGQMLGFMQNQLKQQQAPQQPGETAEAYNARINRTTQALLPYSFDAQGNVVYQPQVGAAAAKTYAEIPKVGAETEETKARTALTTQQIETEIQKGNLTYGQALVNLTQAGVNEAEAMKTLGNYYTFKNGVPVFDPNKYGLRKPRGSGQDGGGQGQGQKQGTTTISGKKYAAMLDANGRPVAIYNPDTGQWEAK